ncbi:hypothetical protein VHE8714_03113 [Vibrio splendidus]|nr:hypothetical protein VHE8714_03113 [Vibrio splendidus]
MHWAGAFLYQRGFFVLTGLLYINRNPMGSFLHTMILLIDSDGTRTRTLTRMSIIMQIYISTRVQKFNI